MIPQWSSFQASGEQASVVTQFTEKNVVYPVATDIYNFTMCGLLLDHIQPWWLIITFSLPTLSAESACVTGPYKQTYGI